MRQIDWTDSRGRKYRVELPDDVPDADAHLGIVVGPPEGLVDLTGLTEEAATRLHNELHRRELWTYRIVQRKPQEVEAALKAALRLDAQIVMAEYARLDRL